MKKFCVLLICLICLVGCSSEEKKTYHTITSDEAYNMMSEREDVIILDVRNNDEYSSGHIEGAVNVPLNLLQTTFKEVSEDKEAVILVYCASGNRSKSASEMLVDMGYNEVYNFGGINNWKYEIVTE